MTAPGSFTAAVLQRLRETADLVRAGWLADSWRRVEGPGRDSYEMTRIETVGPRSAFVPALELERSTAITLAADLRFPESIGGVPLEGDDLELTLWSLFPIDVHHDERELFTDSGPSVAAGPALFKVLSGINTSGSNGKLTVRVHAAESFPYSSWVWFAFTTPRLRARFEQLDIAWAQLYLADVLAGTAEERKAVESAALLVPDDLTTADDLGLDESLRAMAEALGSVRHRVHELEVHAIGHSHIDMNWLWTWPDTLEVIRRDFRSVVSMMDDYPEMTFTHSQAATYEVIKDNEPELFERVQEHVRSGRWELATAQWVEGDTNMASAEGTARQLLEGVRFSERELGARPVVFFAPDTFGHAGNLPQAAASAGVRYYYHHRGNPGVVNDRLWPAYWWEGDDGSRVLALSTPSYSGHITAGEVARAAVEMGHRHGHQHALLFYGVGDHGGGPTRESLDTLGRLRSTPGLPTVACSTVAAFGSRIVASGARLPVHKGESPTVFEGCYTTHADTKRFNRVGESILTTAETLAAMAGLDAEEELSKAWRSVCFHQFHDILDGSAIHDVYEDQARDFAEIEAVAARVSEEALGVLRHGSAPGSVAVTNPLAWDRQDVVTVSVGLPPSDGAAWMRADDGRLVAAQHTSEGICFVAEVPAFATTTYALTDAPGTETGDLRVGDHVGELYYEVETPHFLARVRRDCGVITSLRDKRVNRDLVAYGMPKLVPTDGARPELALNVLQLLDEGAHGMSSWDMAEVHTETSLLRGATTEVIESGPVRIVLEVTRTIRSSTIRQRVTFYRDLARIDFTTAIDWDEPGGPEIGIPNLKVAFTGNLRRPEAWFETPFGAVRRETDGQEVPALRWAALGGEGYGFAVLNDAKYGHDALGSRLRVSLVRTAYDPDPASDLGAHQISYSLVPFVGDWRSAALAQLGAGFNQPLLATKITDASPDIEHDPGWRPTIVADGSIIVSTMKTAGHGSRRVIRMYEGTGRPSVARVDGIPAGAAVWDATIVEDSVEALDVVDGRASVSFAPWQIRTLVIDLS